MAHIDNRVSLGNIISLGATVLTGAGMAAALFVWGGRLSERSDSFDRSILQMQTAISGHETRLRQMEQLSARQDERLLLILDAVRKIEAKIDRGAP